MKITLKLVGYMKFEGVHSGEAIDVPPDSAVQDLLTRYKVAAQHQRYVVPIVNGEETKLSHVLREGDELALFLPVGGG